MAAGHEVSNIDNLCNSKATVFDRIERIVGRRPQFEQIEIRDRPSLRRLLVSHRFDVLTVNLGTGRGYSVLERVRAFSTVSSWPVPYRIVGRRPGEIAQCFADPALAREVLGWQAQLGVDAMCADTWRRQRWAAENIASGDR